MYMFTHVSLLKICNSYLQLSSRAILREKNKNKPIRDSMILRLADYKPLNLKLENTRPLKKLNFVYVMSTSAIGFFEISDGTWTYHSNTCRTPLDGVLCKETTQP